MKQIEGRDIYTAPRLVVVEIESQAVIAASEPPQIQNFETDTNGQPFDITDKFQLQNNFRLGDDL